MKQCTSLDGTMKGESAPVGSFPIIPSTSVVFLKVLCINTLSIFSSLTAALHVVNLILHFILLHSGNMAAFGVSFPFTKTLRTLRTRHQQEATEASSSRI